MEPFVLPTQYPELIRLNKSSDKRPVFWFHGGFGGVEVYRIVAKNLERPFYGIQARGYMTDNYPILGLEEMAAYYIKMIKSVQKEGSYDLGGLSMGGLISYEVTRQLQELGDKANSVVMLETLYEDEQMKETWDQIPRKDFKKERMLRAVNLMLGFNSAVELDLISQSELDIRVLDDEFLEQLIALSIKKGNSKSESSLRNSIQQLEGLLHTLDISSSIYGIPSLPRPEEVNCYYFCNKNVALFTAEGSQKFFQIVDTGHVFDFYECSKRWKEKIPQLVAIEIETPSHFTIFAEPESQKIITEFCDHLYSDEPITNDS
jgi:thioesterase domain-containing protein